MQSKNELHQQQQQQQQEQKQQQQQQHLSDLLQHNNARLISGSFFLTH